MIFIIGGYGQGQEEYASQNYGQECIVCSNVNKYIEMGDTVDKAYENIMALASDRLDAVVIGIEVGNGIVPIDKDERQKRDMIGSLQIKLAKSADSVIRVICGLGTKIK